MFGSAAIVQSVASRRVTSTEQLGVGLVLALIREPVFLTAISMNLVGFGFHLVALRTVPLFLAQSGIAASLAVTAVLAVRVFHDPLSSTDWAAVVAVCAGLTLLASSAGSVGDETASAGFLTGLFAAIVVMALAGYQISRSEGPGSEALLGLLAGFGFAGVSIAARVLPDLHFTALLTSAATYALLLSGGLAFLLYSLALQRGSVTGATAPMIVSQTVTPSAVGVLLLNDGIREGWLPIAAVGFVVTCFGALALARFEGAPSRHA